jgi:hypothetical protein
MGCCPGQLLLTCPRVSPPDVKSGALAKLFPSVRSGVRSWGLWVPFDPLHCAHALTVTTAPVCRLQMTQLDTGGSASSLLSVVTSYFVTWLAGRTGLLWLGGFRSGTTWQWVDGSPASNINCGGTGCGIWPIGQPDNCR